MALVQDPGFWKRFSTAVHLDEEEKQCTNTSSSHGRPTLKHSQSWLDRQKKKKSRRTLICWIFWIVLAFLVTGVVVTVLLLRRYGIIGGDVMQADPANAASYSSGGDGP